MNKILRYIVKSMLILILLLPFSPASAELPQAREISPAGQHLLKIEEQGPGEIGLAQLTDKVSVGPLRDSQERVSEEVFQQAFLKASNTEEGDQFGYSVAVSGNTLVIGAPGEDSDADVVNGDQGNNNALWAGAAYVFVRSGDEWAFQTYLKASNSDFGDYFGYAVAISGDTIVVGAPYEDSSATTVNGDQYDNSIEGTGAAYVFIREGETWTQQSYLKPHNSGYKDFFGQSLDISGDTIVVGSTFEDGESTEEEYDEGAAYVFVRDGDEWSQESYLKAADADGGDFFGYSTAISGFKIVVGAIFGDSEIMGTGAAYVFKHNGSDWLEEAKLTASNEGSGDYFGNSVDISGETIVIGASCEDSKAIGVNGDGSNNEEGNAGAAYIFKLDEDTWSQQAYLKASNTEKNDRFGYSVAVSGNTILVGGFGEDSSTSGIDGDQADNNALEAGAAYLFSPNKDTWSQKAYLKASNTEASDRFGWAVDLSFFTVLVGAYQEDSNATGVGGDVENNMAEDSGAGYAFEIIPECVLFLPLVNK